MFSDVSMSEIPSEGLVDNYEMDDDSDGTCDISVSMRQRESPFEIFTSQNKELEDATFQFEKSQHSSPCFKSK